MAKTERDAVRRQAREFVDQLPAEVTPTEGLNRTGELVMSIVTREKAEQVKPTLEYVRNWMRANAVRRDSYEEYGDLHDPTTEMNDGESPGVGLVLSALYARVAVALEDDPSFEEMRRHMEDPATLADDVRQGLSTVKDGFIGEVMLETAKQRQRSPEVARRLNEARDTLEGMTRELERRRKSGEGPGAYGFVLEWGSEVLDAVAVGIVVAVVVAVVVVALL